MGVAVAVAITITIAIATTSTQHQHQRYLLSVAVVGEARERGVRRSSPVAMPAMAHGEKTRRVIGG